MGENSGAIPLYCLEEAFGLGRWHDSRLISPRTSQPGRSNGCSTSVASIGVLFARHAAKWRVGQVECGRSFRARTATAIAPDRASYIFERT
jgi:hypothetical protein